MSSRPQIKPYSVITNGSMSGNLTSAVTVIDNTTLVSYSYSWSGSTPVGTITVEVSNDYALNEDGSLRTTGTWNAISGISAAVSGNTGSGFINLSNQAGYAIRTKYTRSSGSGTLQAKVVAKVS